MLKKVRVDQKLEIKINEIKPEIFKPRDVRG